MSTLGSQIAALEAETFEVADLSSPEENFGSCSTSCCSCSTSSTCSTTSSSCSSTSSCG